MQALAVLALLAVAVVLFTTERLRADVVAMILVAVLLLTRILSVEQALAGISHPATVTVACMFVLSAGLESSGLVRVLGDRLLRHGPSEESGLLLLIALVIGPISAFVNNTAAVAVFLPVAVRACNGKGISPSRILMPMAFLASLGGTCTVIGTSTNILVSTMARDHDFAPFGMFEFAKPGILLFAAGAAYLVLVGRRLLPERVQAESLTEGYRLTQYLSEVLVLPGSPLAGSTLSGARLGERHGLEVLSIIRQKRLIRAVPEGEEILREGDILLVKAAAQALVGLRDSMGLAVRAGRHPDDADLGAADSALIEAVIPPNSALESRTMKGVDFRHRYGATALALRRFGEDLREKIGKMRLTSGDELLLLVSRTNLERLRRQSDLVVLQELDVAVLQPARAAVAAAIVASVVAAAAFGVYPVVVCAVAGAVLMVVTRCLPVRRVYESVDWRVILLIAGVIPLGTALESTGAASSIVAGIVRVVGDFGPTVVLGTFFLATAVLTGFMSNAATAVLMVPLGLTTAQALGVDGRPFLVAITFAASAAFYTPIGYQTNLLVYGPGGYRFSDYVRVGGPLNLIVWLGATYLIPRFFPF